jgi:FkbM family methyltransferase
MGRSLSELNLVGRNELTSLDRWALERRSRALASPVYLGAQTALCRVLGRYKLYVDTDDVGFGAHVLLDGCWESWLSVFMARRIRPGMRCADVGANHGYYSLLFADLTGPNGRVAAIEPNPRLAALLRRSVSVNGFADRTEVLELAAGAVDGEPLRLIAPPDEPKNGRTLPADVTAIAGVDVIGQRLATSLAHWDRVDFAKIDIEGAEEAAIEGFWPILERDRPELVMEFNAARCADPAALLARLARLYGALSFVDFDCESHRIDCAALLDASRTEDWMLHLAHG